MFNHAAVQPVRTKKDVYGKFWFPGGFFELRHFLSNVTLNKSEIRLSSIAIIKIVESVRSSDKIKWLDMKLFNRKNALQQD